MCLPDLQSLLLRPNNIAMWFWCNTDIILSCVCWDISVKLVQLMAWCLIASKLYLMMVKRCFIMTLTKWVNILRLKQNDCHCLDDLFKHIFFNENVWILLKISLKFVPKVPINSIPVLVQVMAWRQPCDKPLSESMMVRLPMHIYVTQPQLKDGSEVGLSISSWLLLIHHIKWGLGLLHSQSNLTLS